MTGRRREGKGKEMRENKRRRERLRQLFPQ